MKNRLWKCEVLGMNFFETTFHKIFDNVEGIENAKYIGRSCVADIGGGKVMKASFVQTGITGGRKNALSVSIKSKTDGEIDSTTIRFADIWSQRYDICGSIEGPQIMIRHEEAEWFTPEPSKADYMKLSNMVTDYVEFYTELNMEQNEGMSGMGM